MDHGGRSGGCCIARYTGGDAKMMEKVMLKFRPIAPKPATGGSVFGSSSSSDNKSSSGETTYVKAGRGKRKYNTTGTKRRSYGGGRKRVRASRPLIEEQLNNNKLTIRSRDESSSGDTTTVVTLPLLPESPTHQSKTPTSRSTAPIWLSFNSTVTTAPDNNNNYNMNKLITPINHYNYSHQQTAAVGGRYGGGVRSISGRVVGSGVTVECVTETWISGEGLGRTDEERVRNLEWDTCPGFISDGQNRVTWTNRAYKKMVLGDEEAGEMRMSSSGGDDDQEVVVWVAMKEKVPVSYPAFTCRVRVQHTRTKEIKILPCDVWRMDGGGFAWKLDVKAALSLGR